MPSHHPIDPEAQAGLDLYLESMPGGLGAIPGIRERRAAIRRRFESAAVPPNPNVTEEDRLVPGPEGGADVRVRVYRPVDPEPARPAIYYIHGGGLNKGDIESSGPDASMLCEQVGAVVVSVEYRLAPEDPYPAGVDDCYAGLVWLARSAAELGVDPERVALYGASAGGGLAIAVALLARDRGFPALRFQMPVYPMIDDRNETPSSYEVTGIGMWDRHNNAEAWQWYLGDGKADQYAAPARAEDLAGLPPAYIDVGTVDLFRDEDITFALRLMQSGVPTELHVDPGAYHGAEGIAPRSALSARIRARRIEALRRALH